MSASDIGPELRGLTIDRVAYMKPVWRVSMAALIYRAGQLGRIDRHKSEYLWRQMSSREFRLGELQSLEFDREKTTVMGALVAHTVRDMVYTPEELPHMLHLITRMYDLLKRARVFVLSNNRRDRYFERATIPPRKNRLIGDRNALRISKEQFRGRNGC